MKQCIKCNEVKELLEFRIRRGKHEQPCKKCALAYGRRHYQNNRQHYIDRVNQRNREHMQEKRRLIWDYLLEHPCVDCGNADPRVLEFDHVRGVKKYNISEMQSHRCT